VQNLSANNIGAAGDTKEWAKHGKYFHGALPVVPEIAY
jgi:hypothetical protein